MVSRIVGIMQSFEEIPSQFADFLGITLEAGQVFLSTVILLAILLPILYLTKGEHHALILFFFFLGVTFLVGIGWMPFWTLIALITLMAFAWATVSSNAILGE